MFRKARIKLISWYLLIIMLVSIVFSLVIYSGINRELGRFQRMQEIRLRRERELMLSSPFPRELRDFDTQAVTAARMRLTLTLVFINAGIFGLAGLAGYFLAGRTLNPIKEMIDEQNRFITDASHELRTPITSLKTEIEVNLRNKKLSQETKKILESNLEEVNRLQNLSDSLIKLTKYQKADGSIRFEDVSLSDCAKQAHKIVANLAKHKNIAIANKIKENAIKGNRQGLIELFVILLDNAIKYSDENKKITLISEKTNNSIFIYVKDEGMGIPKEDLPHLFNRFYRVDKSRTKIDLQGYGLGLSIAKKIVSQHNGSIAVKSNLGHGSTFIIRFPAKHFRKLF